MHGRLIAAPLLALASFVASVAVAQEAGPAGLAGAWTATAAERDGAPAPDLVGHVLSFEGDAFSIVGPDGELIYGGTFATDSAATPPAIDFHNTAGLAEGQTWEGVFRLDGDALTIVDDAPDPAAPRPTTFAAPAGSGFVLLEFRRAPGG